MKYRSKRRNIVIAIICTTIVLIGATGGSLLMRSERSVSSFCRVAKEQKTILTSDVNYEQRLEAYKKLEAVSPDGIKPDITTIKKGYESIVQDPSKTLSTGFGSE